MFLSISWEENFESIDSGWLTLSNLTTFAKQMFYTLSESPFFSEAFTIMTDKSYVEDIDEYGTRQTLQLIDQHFVAAPATIKAQIDAVIPIDWNKEIGDLIPLDEMDSFISYDGYGYYCKQQGDTTYKSSISYNADYHAPKMLSDKTKYEYIKDIETMVGDILPDGYSIEKNFVFAKWCQFT